MKKILLINDFLFSGGAETVYRTTRDLLLNEGFDVKLFYGSENHCHPKNIFVYLYSNEYRNKLKRILKDFNPDIIHLHGYYHILSSSIFTSIKRFKNVNSNCKVIYTAHDYNFLHPNSCMLEYSKGVPKNSKLNSYLKIFLLHRIDHRGFKYSFVKKVRWLIAHKLLKIEKQIDIFVSPSFFLANLYQKKLNKKVKVVRNPLSFDSITKNNYNKKLKIIYFGRLSREKGLLEFLDLVTKKDLNSFQLDIFGRGDLSDELLSKIKRNKIEDIVSIKGYLEYEKILKELHKYDAMIIPSLWYENAPMTIIEASSKGLIVLGTNHGGIKEMAERYSSCVLFDFKNVSLHDIIEKTHSKIFENTVNRNFSDLSPDYYIDKLKEIYS